MDRPSDTTVIPMGTADYRGYYGPGYYGYPYGYVRILRPRLLWTWLLRASRVAPLERTSDRFRTTPTGSNARTGRSSRTLFARPSLHASPISQSARENEGGNRNLSSPATVLR